MIENTLEKFLAELHKVLEEEPNSYTAAVLNSTLPNSTLYPEQTEHLFHEFANIFRADTELLGNNEIIEHVIENFPYAYALSDNQATRELHIRRFTEDLRDNYLRPQLYLITEEMERSLESQGLEAVSAEQIQNPITGEMSIQIMAQNEEGLIYQAVYNREGALNNLAESPNYNPESIPTTTSPASMPSQTTSVTERSFSETSEQHEQFDDHIATQAEALQDDQLDLLYASNVQQAEAEAEKEKQEAQQKIELESIERNKREYEKAEASRLERLAYEQRQSEDAKRQQTQSRSGRRIAIAAGAGATIFSGGLVGVIVAGDLIGLFS